MNKKTTQYLDGLKDNPYWEKVKRKIKLRDNFACQISGKRINLSVHHISYWVVENGERVSIIGKELEYLEWLILLNQDEHERVHQNNGHALNPFNQNKINAYEFKERNK